ncbi:MAG: hypothetical protein HFJ27_03840 [Clostridia bacterium]|nr:hypothetical protein [Clostridia bacterium]
MKENIVLTEYKIAVTEVLDILEYLPEDLVSNIPIKLMQFLKNNSIPAYKPLFDYSAGLDKIELRNRTRALLAMIYRNYICSEEEQKEYDKILYQNEEKYQKELSEKYDINHIFKEKEEKQNKQLVEYKQPKWYVKLFQKILSFLK